MAGDHTDQYYFWLAPHNHELVRPEGVRHGAGDSSGGLYEDAVGVITLPL